MSQFEPQTLTEDEIPQGVIDDLNEHYKGVTFDLDIGIDEDTVSRKGNFVEKDAELKRGVVSDPATFKPFTGMGYFGKSYLIRINETDTGCSVRQVITMDIFELAEGAELTPLEPMQDKSVK